MRLIRSNARAVRGTAAVGTACWRRYLPKPRVPPDAMEYLSRLTMTPARRFLTDRIRSRCEISRASCGSSSKSMRSAVRAMVAFCLLGGSMAVMADDSDEGRRIELPVPIGHDVKGLRLPVRNDQGKLDMQFDVETARRIDDQNVEMHTAVIQTYNQQTEKPDAKIYLHDSEMNLDTEVITTKDPVKITRDDFLLTADSGDSIQKHARGWCTATSILSSTIAVNFKRSPALTVNKNNNVSEKHINLVRRNRPFWCTARRGAADDSLSSGQNRRFVLAKGRRKLEKRIERPVWWRRQRFCKGSDGDHRDSRSAVRYQDPLRRIHWERQGHRSAIYNDGGPVDRSLEPG